MHKLSLWLDFLLFTLDALRLKRNFGYVWGQQSITVDDYHLHSLVISTSVSYMYILFFLYVWTRLDFLFVLYVCFFWGVLYAAWPDARTWTQFGSHDLNLFHSTGLHNSVLVARIWLNKSLAWSVTIIDSQLKSYETCTPWLPCMRWWHYDGLITNWEDIPKEHQAP
jgi:hypothetical protein